MSDSLRPHGWQYPRIPCPSPTPGDICKIMVFTSSTPPHLCTRTWHPDPDKLLFWDISLLSLEGLTLKLKLQYFGHLMWRTNSLEKTLMMGKFEGRRKGWQRMRRLYNITDSMDMSLSKLQEIVKDQETWLDAIDGVAKSWTWLSNSRNNSPPSSQPVFQIKSYSLPQYLFDLLACVTVIFFLPRQLSLTTHQSSSTCLKILRFMYLFLAVLGLYCCVWGLFSVAVHGLLTDVASFAV